MPSDIENESDSYVAKCVTLDYDGKRKQILRFGYFFLNLIIKYSLFIIRRFLVSLYQRHPTTRQSDTTLYRPIPWKNTLIHLRRARTAFHPLAVIMWTPRSVIVLLVADRIDSPIQRRLLHLNLFHHVHWCWILER